MMTFTIAAICAVFGSVLGSFAGAQVWRLRARQLADGKKSGEEYDRAEYKQLALLLRKNKRHDRSMCLRCGHQLAFRDLIPVVSWLSTKGKCRYCLNKIGWFELMIEVLLAVAFVVSFLAWPWELIGLQWLLFIVWCASLTVLAMLVAYDSKWRILPDSLNLAYALLTGVFVVLRVVVVGDVALHSLALALFIMAGIYAVLYVVSKGRWIGLGDVKLGVGLGLILGSWQAAFVGLFLANLIGCIVVLPGLISKKIKIGSEIAFGPLLALGAFLSFFVNDRIIDWLMLASFF